MKRLRFLTFLALAFFVSNLAWLVWREAHQSYLDNALIAAIKQHNTKRVLDILQQGANPNARNHTTSLSQWQLLWVRLTNQSSDDTFLPTALAILFDMDQVYDLKNNSYRPEPIEIAKALVERGAAVNVKASGFDPDQPLILWVAWLGYPHCTQLLLEHGADANARDADGITALMNAALSRDPATVKVLLEKGADVYARNNDGNTIFTYVSSENNERVFLLLKKAAKRLK